MPGEPGIDEAVTAAGRTPESVRRVYGVIGEIGSNAAAQGLDGTIHHCVDTLTGWALLLGFVFWPAADPEDQLSIFSFEVIPAVRERVQAVRSGR